jgi:hypothetical protein
MVHAERAVMPEYRFDSSLLAQLTRSLPRSKLSGE